MLDLPAYVRGLTGVELLLLAIGGGLYSIGAVVYALKRPEPVAGGVRLPRDLPHARRRRGVRPLVQRVPPDRLTVLFDRPTMDGIGAGTVTLAFRRWRRPTVKPGGTQTTAVGVLAIDDVRVVATDEITADDALRAGAASREALLAELGRRDGELYRIEFHLAGPDPRVELRQRDELTDEEAADIGRRLARLDAASSHGPWTAAVLEPDRRPAGGPGRRSRRRARSGAPVVQDRRPQAQGAWD